MTPILKNPRKSKQLQSSHDPGARDAEMRVRVRRRESFALSRDCCFYNNILAPYALVVTSHISNAALLCAGTSGL